MLYTSPEDLSRFIGDDTGASYQVAHFMMSIVDWLLGIFGLEHNITLVTFLYAAVVLGISIAAGYIFQVVILWICRQIARRWSLPVYDELTKLFYNQIDEVPYIEKKLEIASSLEERNRELDC